MYRVTFSALLVCVAIGSIAQDATTAKAAFERLKSLAGTWKGKALGTEGTAKYKVTGAGSAVIEVLFPDQPHEMVTVFHLDGDKLMLTHYCAAGNQPRMKMVSMKDDEISFEFDGGTNMKESDMHMHSLKIKFVDKDHIVSDWVSMADGKPGMTATFDLQRAKS